MAEFLLLAAVTLAAITLGFFLVRRIQGVIEQNRKDVARKRSAPYGTAPPVRKTASVKKKKRSSPSAGRKHDR